MSVDCFIVLLYKVHVQAIHEYANMDAISHNTAGRQQEVICVLHRLYQATEGDG